MLLVPRLLLLLPLPLVVGCVTICSCSCTAVQNMRTRCVILWRLLMLTLAEGRWLAIDCRAVQLLMPIVAVLVLIAVTASLGHKCMFGNDGT